MLRPLFLQYQAVFSVIQRPIPGPPVMLAVFEALRVCAHADGHGLFLPADAARNFKAFFAPPNGAVQPTFPVSRYSRQTFSKKSSSFGMGRTGRHSNTHAPSRYSISCTRPPQIFPLRYYKYIWTGNPDSQSGPLSISCLSYYNKIGWDPRQPAGGFVRLVPKLQ